MKLHRVWSAVTAAVVFLVVMALPVRGGDGPTIAAEVQKATGITRPYDTQLEAVAQVRAVEIQTVFDHRHMPELYWYWWGEVIQWNNHPSIPMKWAVQQWMASPSHHAILTNPDLKGIGCAETVVGAKHYYVCLFGQSSQPPAEGLPDTAMAQD